MEMGDENKLKELLERYHRGKNLTNKEKLFIIKNTEPFNRKLCGEVINDSPGKLDLSKILDCGRVTYEVKAEAAEKILQMKDISDYYLVFLTKCPFPKETGKKIREQAFKIFYKRHMDNSDDVYTKITARV